MFSWQHLQKQTHMVERLGGFLITSSLPYAHRRHPFIDKSSPDYANKYTGEDTFTRLTTHIHTPTQKHLHKSLLPFSIKQSLYCTSVGPGIPPMWLSEVYMFVFPC